MTTQVPVLIVGAGISGLTCAYYLRKSGIDAQVVEAADRPGGVIRSDRRDGFLLELGPQSFSGTPQLLDLCRDLGIQNELIEAPANAPRFLLINGRLKPAPLSPSAFFASSLFSAKTKWSLLRDALGHSTPPYIDESVATFTRRKFSAELLDKLAGPFVSGIYAGDPEKLSLRAAFPQVHEAERAAGSILRGTLRAAKSKSGPKQRPTLQSFKNGNATLINALAANLGPALHLETSLTEIRRANAERSTKYNATLAMQGSTERITAANIVIATPTNATATLLQNLHSELSSAIASLEYAPIYVVSLGYRKSALSHSLDGFGFLVPRSEGLRTLGTVWNSSLFPGRAPEGQALLTSFVGGATDPQAVMLSPNAIVALAHKEIAPLLQIREGPVFSNAALYPRALPQYNLGHAERLAVFQKLRAELPGLWLTGNYLRGPSLGACIEHSLSVAEQIRESIKRQKDEITAHA